MRTLHGDVHVEAVADETFSEVHGGQKEEVEKVWESSEGRLLPVG